MNSEIEYLTDRCNKMSFLLGIAIGSLSEKGSRYLVKDSGTSQSPKSTRQRAKLKAATVLFPARLL